MLIILITFVLKSSKLISSSFVFNRTCTSINKLLGITSFRDSFFSESLKYAKLVRILIKSLLIILPFIIRQSLSIVYRSFSICALIFSFFLFRSNSIMHTITQVTIIASTVILCSLNEYWYRYC